MLDEENLGGEEVGDEKEALFVNNRPIKINNLFEQGRPKRLTSQVEEEKVNVEDDPNASPRISSALPELSIKSPSKKLMLKDANKWMI